MGARPHCLDEPSWQKQNRSTRPTATVAKTAAATLLTASRRASRFLIRELTEAHPVVNLSLFTRRNFTVVRWRSRSVTERFSATPFCCGSGSSSRRECSHPPGARRLVGEQTHSRTGARADQPDGRRAGFHGERQRHFCRLIGRLPRAHRRCLAGPTGAPGYASRYGRRALIAGDSSFAQNGR